MSNKIIGIDEYGSFAKNEKNENVCHKCMYFNYHKHEAPCKSCLEVYYYPNHLEIAKIEAELTPEPFTINDMYVTSKQLFDCQDELKASQKELIDLQNENKQLKEIIKELENQLKYKDFMIENGLGADDMRNDITMPYEH